MQLFRPKSPRYVIVDVDVGCDDAWALYVLFKAMDFDLCNVLAITCVNGNTSVNHVAKNVLRLLESVGKEQLIPVYKGSAKELISTPMLDKFHGEDGLSDLEWATEPDLSLIRKEHAVNKMYELVKERPKEVSIICLGPLTNLAIALRMFPDMAEDIRDVSIMGGNNLGVGNTTKAAEFNFYLDSEAVSIVLETLKCPITILTWEACLASVIPMSWRKNVLGVIESPVLDILNPVEYKAFRTFPHYIPCDALVTSLFIHPGIVQKASDWHVAIELEGQQTRGQLVLDHLQENVHNVKIIEKIEVEDLKRLFLWVCGDPGAGGVEIV